MSRHTWIPTLSSYRRNIYSQNGEDGVLEEILRRLHITGGFFVEFGAWDGKYLSNAFRLLEQGWHGVYIEGDPDKFQGLVRNMAPFAGRVEILNAYVTPEGECSLDNLLAPTKASPEFEVLSIDVDSCDWQIWESVRNYTPLVVVIEIESSIPVGIEQTHRGPGVEGSSFTSTVQLGAIKGYTPVCHIGNLVFVRNDRVAQLQLPPTELLFPERLFDYAWKRLSYGEES